MSDYETNMKEAAEIVRQLVPGTELSIAVEGVFHLQVLSQHYASVGHEHAHRPAKDIAHLAIARLIGALRETADELQQRIQ